MNLSPYNKLFPHYWEARLKSLFLKHILNVLQNTACHPFLGVELLCLRCEDPQRCEHLLPDAFQKRCCTALVRPCQSSPQKTQPQGQLLWGPLCNALCRAPRSGPVESSSPELCWTSTHRPPVLTQYLLGDQSFCLAGPFVVCNRLTVCIQLCYFCLNSLEVR